MYYVPVTAHLKNNHPAIFESNFPIIFVTLTFSRFSLSNRATIGTFRIVKFRNVHLKNTILLLFSTPSMLKYSFMCSKRKKIVKKPYSCTNIE
jgi:hypothetical protein